ncbi:hypothetical protein [Vagococcus fluvialis]|uniref:hypothetical protein n=1 Tax=Vagococcus fluvialis TaxID=2738 RepID=UPI0037B8F9DF
MLDQNVLNTISGVATNQNLIEKEIFSLFKIIPNSESNFIRKAKTIVCYEIHLPFSLGFTDGYTFKIINREQVFVYSETPRHEHMTSVMKCYGFFSKNWDKVTEDDKGNVIGDSLQTINDIIKIIKSRFGETSLFLLNSANRDYSDMLFTYSVNLKKVSHGGAVINTDSIYYPTKATSKPLFTSENEYNYLLERLEDKEMNRMIDAFYYLCLAKENELERNFNSAVINLQTGFEIFMYYLFNTLVEEGICSEPKKRVPFRNLLDEHLQPLLATDEDSFYTKDVNSVLYNYWEYLYLFRNKIVHDGYVINFIEYTEFSYPACDNLIKYLDKTLNEKFPQLNIKIEYSN